MVDPDGRLVHGDFEPSSELGLHLGIYLQHNAGAVVHTHAPACTAVASVRTSCRASTTPCSPSAVAVPVAPYATFGSRELAENVVAALAGRSAVLMASHGAITYGSTLAKAYEAMELLGVGLRSLPPDAPPRPSARVLTAEQTEAVVTAAREKQYGAPRKGRPPRIKT